MGKNSNMQQLVRFTSLAVAHKIGEIINPTSLYADKYRKESQNFMMLAHNVSLRENWNIYDKEIIKKDVIIATTTELKNRKHMGNEKFNLMDQEISKALARLELLH